LALDILIVLNFVAIPRADFGQNYQLKLVSLHLCVCETAAGIRRYFELISFLKAAPGWATHGASSWTDITPVCHGQTPSVALRLVNVLFWST
jgi:hypothetical protein